MGEDREGKMSSISARVVANGGSLEDSRMTRLRGEIGLILVVRINDQSSGNLVDELTGEEGLQVRVTQSAALL
eukprot:5631098-Pyramimonas_sp.AAC.1